MAHPSCTDSIGNGRYWQGEWFSPYCAGCVHEHLSYKEHSTWYLLSQREDTETGESPALLASQFSQLEGSRFSERPWGGGSESKL